MIVEEIQARLKAETGNTFAIIEGAAALSEIVGRPSAIPAAYVLVMREASGENTRMSGVLQRTEMDFAVVIVTENLADDRGEAAAHDIDALKRTVRRVLIGWEPASADDIVTHVAGELTRARDGVVWWEDTFATATLTQDEA